MPFPFIQIAISIAFSFLGQLLAPKNKTKDTGLDQFQVPTATEDRPKPVFVGTVRHLSPNCIWYGDYSAKPIKNQVGLLQGILSFGAAYLSKQIIGYEYRLGFQLDLGWGELGHILKIRMADKVAWTGSVASGAITIDSPELFGGLTSGSNGGFRGIVVVYAGDGVQSADSYVVAKSGATPAYKNDIVLVFKGLDGSSGAYVGNSASLPDMTFDVRRCPNTLAVTGGKHIIDTYDANPVCALYEFMTREKNQFGGGFSPSQFDLFEWRQMAEQVYAEGLGISRMFDATLDVETVINEYLQLIDGVINIDMTTGRFQLVLARNDYDPDLIPVFNDDNVLEVTSFKRGSWVETYNEAKLSYIDRTQEFVDIPVAAQDVANSSGQAEVKSTTIDIKGLTNPATANQAVFRELRVVSTPLSTLSIKVNRQGFVLYPGGVFKWVSPKYGVESMIFRVTEVDQGLLTANTIEVKAVQDIFSLGDTAYDPPEATTWTPPTTTPTNISSELLIEQPYFFHGTDNTRVASIAAQPDGSQLGYDLYVRESTVTDYGVAKRQDQLFTPKGTLVSGYNSTAYNTSSQLIVAPVSLMSDLPTPITPEDITAGAGGLLIIGSEILAYETYTIVSGNYVFNGVWGGLLDTVLANHSTSDIVWFISGGIGIDFTNYTPAATIKAKLTSKSPSGSIALASATEITL